MSAPLPHQRVIPQFRWPHLNNYADARAIDSAFSTGIEMFAPLPPKVLECEKANGEKYLKVTSTGYAAVWPEEHRKQNRIALHVGRDKQWRGDYLAACFAASETPRLTVYVVDIEGHTCHDRKTGCPCPAWEASGKRFCKHLLGTAWLLCQPYRIASSGLIIRLKREV